MYLSIYLKSTTLASISMQVNVILNICSNVLTIHQIKLGFTYNAALLSFSFSLFLSLLFPIYLSIYLSIYRIFMSVCMYKYV